jgi:hypothetical protein
LDAVETLAVGVAEKRTALMVYKVIIHQLDRDKLETVLQQRRPEVIVLVRKRLDVWVSRLKAVEVGKWHHRDTTAIEVSVDVEQFVRWFKQVDDWYQFAMDVTGKLGLRVLVLDYDRDLDHPADEMRRSIALWLRLLRIRLPSGPVQDVTPRERQDAATDPFSKIKNGDEVRAKLIELGMLDYALSSPLADRISERRQVG